MTSKEAQRKKQLTVRKNLSEKEVNQKSKAIEKQLITDSKFKNSKTIMIYIAFNNEVKTKNIIKKMLAADKKVIVPITNSEKKKLYLSEIKNFDKELEVGAYGVLEPKKQYRRLVSPSDLDLIIMPGVAFDENGNRIGYGGGYYDRLLSDIPQVETIALAFEEQLINRVKTNQYDQQVKQIITEKRELDCK